MSRKRIHTPEMSEYRKKFTQQRNYERCWRQQQWELTFEEWLEVWGDKIELRGVHAGTYYMMRLNQSLPWSKDNVALAPNVYSTQKKEV